MLRARIPPPVYGLVTAAVMAWLDGKLPLWRPIDPPLTRIGWVFITAGLVFDAHSIIGFLRAHTTVNPMYLGLLLLLMGWGILLGSLAPWIAILAFAKILAVMQIAPEEAALEAKFGDAYRDYRQRVHRWVGRAGS